MDRTIEVRLSQSKEVSFDGKGKKTERLGPDPERIGAAIHAQVERAVQERYGDGTSVRFVAARTPDIRLSSSLPGHKPGEVKSAVQQMVAEAMEDLDADALG